LHLAFGYGGGARLDYFPFGERIPANASFGGRDQAACSSAAGARVG